MTVKVTISAARPTRLARLPVELELPGSADSLTILDVKHALAAKFPQFKATRQKLAPSSDAKKALADEQALTDAGTEFAVKDLGAQISWRTVFLTEYAGPLVAHPLLYFFGDVVYGGPVQHSQLQKWVCAMITVHFIKRELETLFVHRFSHATMPWYNIFKNSAHYWITSGFALAYALYGPTYAANSPYIKNTLRADPRFIYACFALYVYAQVSNFATHITLRNLRPPGTKRRAIPYGYGFTWLSFPNYWFEILAWGTIAVLTGSYVSYIFLGSMLYQMGEWAIKKQRAYKKEFGKAYPPERKLMIPFIF